MPPPVPIPADVQAWLLDVFGACNERVSGIVSAVPTTWETSLDSLNYIFNRRSGPISAALALTLDAP